MRAMVPAMAFSLLASSAALAQADRDGENEDHPHVAFHRVFGGGRLGVEAIQISKEVRRVLGAPEEGGVLVNSVKADSVAAEAGIRAGDVIVEVAGQKVQNVSSIRRALADQEAGQSVPVVLIREKRSLTVNAKLRERPKGTDFSSMGVELPGSEGFLHGPEMRKQLDRLSARLSDMEKRLASLESKK